MLPIQPFKQRRGFCGPAVLWMVARYYGVRKSERELARICHASAERGTSLEGLTRGAHPIGLSVYAKDNVRLAEVRTLVMKKKVPVIVDWFSEDEGHYSVVTHIDRRFIWLQDPAIGRMRKFDLKTFQRIWFDFPGPVLRAPEDLILRRMIVIRPHKHEET